MTWTTELLTCQLCGASDLDVAIRLIRWAIAEPGMKYDHIPRCQDNDACQRRVEAAGRIWPEERRVAL